MNDIDTTNIIKITNFPEVSYKLVDGILSYEFLESNEYNFLESKNNKLNCIILLTSIQFALKTNNNINFSTFNVSFKVNNKKYYTFCLLNDDIRLTHFDTKKNEEILIGNTSQVKVATLKEEETLDDNYKLIHPCLTLYEELIKLLSEESSQKDKNCVSFLSFFYFTTMISIHNYIRKSYEKMITVILNKNVSILRYKNSVLDNKEKLNFLKDKIDKLLTDCLESLKKEESSKFMYGMIAFTMICFIISVSFFYMKKNNSDNESKNQTKDNEDNIPDKKINKCIK